MKTAHAIFGAVVVAFGVAAFVTFYDEFKLGTQTPPHPNAAAQKSDSLTPANSIAHNFAVLHHTGKFDRARACRRAKVRSDGPPGDPNTAAPKRGGTEGGFVNAGELDRA